MIKINFTGDISLNNRYQDFNKSNTNPFKDVENLFADADFNIGNLECLCSEGTRENKLKVPRLKTSEGTLNLLKPLRFNMLSLAHNHIYDNCEEGIACTLDKLQALCIQPIGYGQEKGNDPYMWRAEVKNLPIAVITAIHKDTNPHLPKDVQLNLPWYDVERIISAIHTAKEESRFVIVYLHWGGRVEGGYMPDWYEIQDSHRFIDEGADVVIGSHSHTVQPYELYKGKYIFYSLGNFCFDDTITDGKVYPIGKFRKRLGLFITLDIKPNKDYKVQLHTIYNNACIIKKCNKQWKIKRRNFKFSILRQSKAIWRIDHKLQRKVYPIFQYLADSPDSFLTKLSKIRITKLLGSLKQ